MYSLDWNWVYEGNLRMNMGQIVKPIEVIKGQFRVKIPISSQMERDKRLLLNGLVKSWIKEGKKKPCIFLVQKETSNVIFTEVISWIKTFFLSNFIRILFAILCACYIYIYIYIYIYTHTQTRSLRVGWRVHRLTKILSWDVTK